MGMLFLSIAPERCHAQWVQTSGTEGVVTKCFAANGANLFAGTSGGVFLSTDSGSHWTATGLTNAIIFDLVASGTDLFAATRDSGAFLSTDNASHWTAMSDINNGFIIMKDISALAVYGEYLLAGTNGVGVFISTDKGANWTEANSGFLLEPCISCILVFGPKLFAVIPNQDRIFLSTDTGAHWTDIQFPDRWPYKMIASGANLFAGTRGGGMFISTDSGAHWATAGLTNAEIFDLAVSDADLFAATNDGVFLSRDSGAHWTAVNTGLPDTVAFSLTVYGGYIYAGMVTGGVFRRPLDQMLSAAKPPSALPPKPFGFYSRGFSGSNARMRYTLAHETYVSFAVFDMAGRMAFNAINRTQPAGDYAFPIPSGNLRAGCYVLSFSAGDFAVRRNLAVLK
jgi:photosystem II stability/assembly factor-like uncharacterized protein